MKMYKKPPKSPRRFRKKYIALLVLALLLVAGGWYGYRQYEQSTIPVIQNNAGRTYPMDIPNSKTKHFDEVFFGFDLPADWRQVEHSGAPYNLYSFQSTLKNADNRSLDIYADTLPTTLAVNRFLAVKSQGSNVSHGQVSDNCTTLIPSSAGTGSTRQLSVPARWDGVDFLCDNDRTTREVIGTSSPGNVNKVTLNGPTKGPHSFFFVYDDKNVTPDYSIIYNVLDSFTVE
jgi:hypothetical protein